VIDVVPVADPVDLALEAVDEACRQRGLAYFLYGGSCLGFYRDGAYLTDDDIDVTLVCSEEEYHEVWRELAELPGWTDSCGLRTADVQVDLHYTPKQPPYVVPHWRPNPFAFQDFDIVTYKGQSYRVPGPIEKYLKWEYTKAWRKPMSRAEWMTLETVTESAMRLKDAKHLISYAKKLPADAVIVDIGTYRRQAEEAHDKETLTQSAAI
jgi:uncharacterized protein YbdZ (MbtH family)